MISTIPETMDAPISAAADVNDFRKQPEDFCDSIRQNISERVRGPFDPSGLERLGDLGKTVRPELHEFTHGRHELVGDGDFQTVKCRVPDVYVALQIVGHGAVLLRRLAFAFLRLFQSLRPFFLFLNARHNHLVVGVETLNAEDRLFVGVGFFVRHPGQSFGQFVDDGVEVPRVSVGIIRGNAQFRKGVPRLIGRRVYVLHRRRERRACRASDLALFGKSQKREGHGFGALLV